MTSYVTKAKSVTVNPEQLDVTKCIIEDVREVHNINLGRYLVKFSVAIYCEFAISYFAVFLPSK